MHVTNLPAPDKYRVQCFVVDERITNPSYCQHVSYRDGREAYLIRELVGTTEAKQAADEQIALRFTNQDARPKSSVEWVNGTNMQIVQNGWTVFCSLVLSILDAQRNTIEFVNAGHPAILQLTSDFELTEIGAQETGVPVGIIPDFQFVSVECEMRVGDVLFLRSFDFSDTLEAELREAVEGQLADRIGEEGTMELVASLMLEFAARSDTSDQFCVLAIERVRREIELVIQ